MTREVLMEHDSSTILAKQTRPTVDLADDPTGRYLQGLKHAWSSVKNKSLENP